LKDLSEIKERAEQQAAQTGKGLQEFALSNLEKLRSFYDPSDPRQRMIRERLGGDTIKGAFFVWTTGLASTLQRNPSPVTQSDPGPQSAAIHDVVPAAGASQPSASNAIAVASPPTPQPTVVDSQPAISCGVLELVKIHVGARVKGVVAPLKLREIE
jgi:hypothetical protein